MVGDAGADVGRTRRGKGREAEASGIKTLGQTEKPALRGAQAKFSPGPELGCSRIG